MITYSGKRRDKEKQKASLVVQKVSWPDRDSYGFSGYFCRNLGQEDNREQTVWVYCDEIETDRWRPLEDKDSTFSVT